MMFLRFYNEAPVSRVKGNEKPSFTYEPCMEQLCNWQRAVYRVNTKTEGKDVTFVRWDLGGVMHPASTLILVFRDGGIRLIRNIDYYASVESPQFSQDGKIFSCTIIESSGLAYQLAVDVDTMACETIDTGTPS